MTGKTDIKSPHLAWREKRNSGMEKPKFARRAFARTAGIIIWFAFCIVRAQDPGDTLERGFHNPPDSAKPRVWWHWMNGNITKEGIKLDLEWMKRTGLGGFQNFDAALATPQIVDKRLSYMTPEWKDAFLYAATLADELGLEMAIAGSPGWSETGGPWVPPEQAMKKLVWSTHHGRRRETFQWRASQTANHNRTLSKYPARRGIQPDRHNASASAGVLRRQRRHRFPVARGRYSNARTASQGGLRRRPV